MERERLEELAAAYLDRTIAPEEGEELFGELRENPEARRYLLLASHTDLALYDQGRAHASQRIVSRPGGRPPWLFRASMNWRSTSRASPSSG